MEFGATEEEVLDLQAGKEFAIIQTSQGKVFYAGSSMIYGKMKNLLINF